MRDRWIFIGSAVVADDVVAEHPALDARPARPAETAEWPGWLSPNHSWSALRRRRSCAAAPNAPATARAAGPPAGQVHALGGGAAFDVGQQDRGVAGPVDVVDDQVVDAVGDDAGVDAEQQPVGDHDVEVREHRLRSLVEDSSDSSMAEDVVDMPIASAASLLPTGPSGDSSQQKFW